MCEVWDIEGCDISQLLGKGCFPCHRLEESPNQNRSQESKHWDGFAIMVSFTSLAVALLAAGAGVISAPAATYFWSSWTDGKSKITQNNGPDGKFSVKWSGDKGNFVLGKGWNTGGSRSFNQHKPPRLVQANPPPERSSTPAPSSPKETATSPSTVGPPAPSSSTTSSRRTATTTRPTTPRPRSRATSPPTAARTRS